jgi:hypothetical protein
MENTDKHIVLASEEVQRRNLVSIRDYTKETRNIVRDLEKKVILIQKELINKNAEIQGLNARIAQLQIKKFSGGPTT